MISKLNYRRLKIKRELKTLKKYLYEGAEYATKCFYQTNDQNFLDEAIECYRKIISNSDTPELNALFLRSLLWKEKGELKLQRNDLRNLFLIGGKNHDQSYVWFYYLGVSYNQSKHFKNAEKYIKKSINLYRVGDISLVKIYEMLGWVYHNMGNSKKALKKLKFAEKLMNKNKKIESSVFSSFGFVYREENNFKLAETYYKKFIKYEKKNPDGWYNLGLVYSDQGKTLKKDIHYKNAIYVFVQCLEYEKEKYKKQDTLFMLGKCYEKINELKTSIKYYTKCTKMNTAVKANVYKRRGKVYKKLREYKKAKKDFHISIKLDPQYYKTKLQKILDRLSMPKKKIRLMPSKNYISETDEEKYISETDEEEESLLKKRKRQYKLSYPVNKKMKI
jgi:tetratricopeptide (TPR) repeat protein